MRKLSFLPFVILLIMIGSCKKENMKDQPKLTSDVTSYYSTKLQPLQSGKIYEYTPDNSTTYKIQKGSNLTVGTNVTLSINQSSHSILSINTSNSSYDVITVSQTLGAASAGQDVFDGINYQTVFYDVTVRVAVSGVPTQPCDGLSYVASITDLPGTSAAHTITQVDNFFVITMTSISYTDQSLERSEINDYDNAFESYAQSLSTTNPQPVPDWTKYVKYDWTSTYQVSYYSGKFVMRLDPNLNKYFLYLTEPEYPASTCIAPITPIAPY